MKTECEKYKEYMREGIHTESNQRIYEFPNGWGASVIEGLFTYGLELMPITFDGKGDYGFDWEPFGYLTEKELEEHLTDIYENGAESKRLFELDSCDDE